MKYKTLPTSMFAALLTVSATHAAIVNVTAFEDITLDQGDGNQNGRDHLLVGSNSGSGPYHALAAFDLSSTITLAVGETLQINSVTIDFSEQSVGQGGPFDLNVAQYGFGFIPTIATYAAPAVGDTTAGGTLGTSFGSTTINGAGTLDTVTLSTGAALETAVGTALTAGSEFRIILTGLEDTSVNFARLKRSDIQLNIDYDVVAVPEPSSAALLGLGGLALILRRRK